MEYDKKYDEMGYVPAWGKRWLDVIKATLEDLLKGKEKAYLRNYSSYY